MWLETKQAVSQLQKSIDGTLTNKEKQTFIEAYLKDKRGILRATQNELRSFVISDYSQRSYDLVWKKWIQVFQKHEKIKQDGVYGPNTFKQIVQYQEKNWLKVDGIIGRETLRSIAGWKSSTQWKERTKSERKEEKKTRWLFARLFGKKESRETVSSTINYPPRNKTETKQLQMLLRKEKHYRGSIDGDFGTGSKKALQSFLQAKWYYTWAMDAKIWSWTLKAIQLFNSWGKKPNAVRKSPKKTTTNEISNWNDSLRSIPKSNREFIDKFVPRKWKKEFAKFAKSLKPREILRPWDPIVVCNSSTNRALFIKNGKYKEVTVWFWVNGFSDWYVGTGDKKTPRWVVTRFSSVNIPKDPYGDASNSGSKTLKWAALMWNDTITTEKVPLKNGKLWYKQTGKWHHGVVDRRVWRNDSNGCVTYAVSDIRRIASSVKSNWGKWYWFVA